MKKYLFAPKMEFFLVVFLPVVLANSPLIPIKANPLVLAAVLLISLIITYVRVNRKKWTWKDLGITLKNIDLESIIVHILVTTIFCLGFVYLYYTGRTHRLNFVEVISSFFFSFAQVIIFQGYMMKIGKVVFKENAVINIFVNVIIFTFMHSFFPSVGMKEYILLAIAGTGFSVMYHFYENSIMVGLFHYATNLLSIYMCMFHTFN